MGGKNSKITLDEVLRQPPPDRVSPGWSQQPSPGSAAQSNCQLPAANSQHPMEPTARTQHLIQITATLHHLRPAASGQRPAANCQALPTELKCLTPSPHEPQPPLKPQPPQIPERAELLQKVKAVSKS